MSYRQQTLAQLERFWPVLAKYYGFQAQAQALFYQVQAVCRREAPVEATLLWLDYQIIPKESDLPLAHALSLTSKWVLNYQLLDTDACYQQRRLQQAIEQREMLQLQADIGQDLTLQAELGLRARFRVSPSSRRRAVKREHRISTPRQYSKERSAPVRLSRNIKLSVPFMGQHLNSKAAAPIQTALAPSGLRAQGEKRLPDTPLALPVLEMAVISPSLPEKSKALDVSPTPISMAAPFAHPALELLPIDRAKVGQNAASVPQNHSAVKSKPTKLRPAKQTPIKITSSELQPQIMGKQDSVIAAARISKAVAVRTISAPALQERGAGEAAQPIKIARLALRPVIRSAYKSAYTKVQSIRQGNPARLHSSKLPRSFYSPAIRQAAITQTFARKYSKAVAQVNTHSPAGAVLPSVAQSIGVRAINVAYSHLSYPQEKGRVAVLRAVTPAATPKWAGFAARAAVQFKSALPVLAPLLKPEPPLRVVRSKTSDGILCFGPPVKATTLINLIAKPKAA